MATVDFALNPGEQEVRDIMGEYGWDRIRAIREYRRNRECAQFFRQRDLGERLYAMHTEPTLQRVRLCGECIMFHWDSITCDELQELIWADRSIGSLWDMV